MLHRIASCVLLLLALAVPSCGDPPDESPLGREIAAMMARPEQTVERVTVQHLLVGFVGAMRGSESKHTFEEAHALTWLLLERIRKGEDFGTLVTQYSNDDGNGIYTLTPENRDSWAENFADVSYRLAVGEVGVAGYQPSRGPFGWHIIKRLK